MFPKSGPLWKQAPITEPYLTYQKASVVWCLACWPLAPKFAGSNPAEAVGILQA
jgi:hypothetical protein